ncbi:MAG: diguanylate cyclase [Candidatus Sedimenticola sp. 20ELBAFRAG]
MDIRLKFMLIPALVLLPITLLLLLALNSFVNHQLVKEVRSELEAIASTTASALKPYGIEHDIYIMDQLADELGTASDARITILMNDGTVLGDSDLSASQVETTESYADRPEFFDALSKGKGSSLRYSDTLKQEMLYYAVRQQVGEEPLEHEHDPKADHSHNTRHFHVVRAARSTDRMLEHFLPIKLAFYSAALTGAVAIILIGIAGGRHFASRAQQTALLLEQKVAERTKSIHLLQRLGSSLSACSKLDEAAEVIHHMIRRLLPETRGAIFITKSSRNAEEMLVCWGGEWPDEQQFSPDACWAMRKGRMHLSNDDDIGMTCSHLTCAEFKQSLCIPLIAQGETIGSFTALTDEDEWTERDINMAQTLSEQISIILASLQLRESLKQQAIRDPLTGLFNRRYMVESLQQSISRADRKDSTLGVMMIDIDDFKTFNDNYGHDVGDLVLKQIAAEMRLCTRKEDTLSRYGGEEFCLVCPDLTEKAIEELAVRLCNQIRKLTLTVRETALSDLTISIGIAAYPGHAKDAETLIKIADDALYQAKASGKNRFVTAGIVKTLQFPSA